MAVWNAAVVGGIKSGKTSLCLRLVAHRFDPYYKETETTSPFYVRSDFANEDCLVMFEDTPAVEKLSSQQLLQNPWWFEQFEEEKLLGEEDEDAGEDVPLVKKKKKGTAAGPKQNPIYNKQKRFGMFVVFDLSSEESFTQAGNLLKDIFARAVGFNPNGWKMAPIVVILVGTKADIVGSQRVVTQEMIDELIDTWSNLKLIDRHTKEPRRHITYVETSAKQGTNCDQLIPLFLSKIRALPSKRAVYTPDSIGGWYGQLLENYEWAREFHGWKEDMRESTARVSRKTRKVLGPVFKMKWLKDSMGPLKKNTIDRIPSIPVPDRVKVFPRSMWFCFCFRKPKGEDEESSGGEEEAEESESEYEE